MDLFLTILLIILKVIGITLLSILGILLLLVLLILFWPIKYNASGLYDNGTTDIKAFVSWLSIIKAIYKRTDSNVFTVKILFWNIYNSAKPKDVKNKKIKKKKAKKNVNKKDTDKSVKNIKNYNDVKSNDIKNKDTKNAVKNVDNNIDKEDTTQAEDNREAESKAIFNTVDSENVPANDKTQNDIDKNNIFDKNEDKNEDNTETKSKFKRYYEIIQTEDFKIAFDKVKKKLIRLLKIVLPKKLSIDAVLGFDDPGFTGKIIAVTSMLYPVLHKHIHIKGDFENSTICVKGYFRGRITIIKILIILCSLYFDRRIKKLIKQFKEA